MSTETDQARATLNALLAALLELVASLDHPVPPSVGVCLSQVTQLAGQLDRQLAR